MREFAGPPVLVTARTNLASPWYFPLALPKDELILPAYSTIATVSRLSALLLWGDSPIPGFHMREPRVENPSLLVSIHRFPSFVLGDNPTAGAVTLYTQQGSIQRKFP